MLIKVVLLSSAVKGSCSPNGDVDLLTIVTTRLGGKLPSKKCYIYFSV
jgi:hypothetical protein